MRCCEVLVGTYAVRRNIRENTIHKLYCDRVLRRRRFSTWKTRAVREDFSFDVSAST